MTTQTSTTQTYAIMWGHDGDHTDAYEASRYAAEVWGEVEAASPEAAIEIVDADLAKARAGEVINWWHNPRTNEIHIIIDSES